MMTRERIKYSIFCEISISWEVRSVQKYSILASYVWDDF